jgi:hypothetical protein
LLKVKQQSVLAFITPDVVRVTVYPDNVNVPLMFNNT